MDSRERKPLQFIHPDFSRPIKCRLSVGDYMVRFKDGRIPLVVFERKSFGDLFGTLTSGYPRFKLEILRAQKHKIKLILIIEGSITRVLKGYKRKDFRKIRGSKIHIDGLSILKTIFSIYVRYGVVPIFCNNRDEIQGFIIEYYQALWRKNLIKQIKRRSV